MVGVDGEGCSGGAEDVVVWDTFGRVAEACVVHGARLVRELRRRGRPGVQVAVGRGGPAAKAAVERLANGG